MLEFIILDIIVVSFLLEFIDIYAGMGFGIITPILLILGYGPLEIIPPVLFLSGLFGLSAAFFHHFFKNIKYTDPLFKKVISLTFIFGFVGIILGSLVAIVLPTKVLEQYIGVVIILLGAYVIFQKPQKFFSWVKLSFFSIFAGFNKGMTGGGYGPLLTSGQLLSGVISKHSVSITVLIEGSISFFGFFIFYFLSGETINWKLLISMLIGGGLAVVPSVYLVKKTHVRHLRLSIGIASIIIGLLIFMNRMR